MHFYMHLLLKISSRERLLPMVFSPFDRMQEWEQGCLLMLGQQDMMQAGLLHEVCHTVF